MLNNKIKIWQKTIIRKNQKKKQKLANNAFSLSSIMSDNHIHRDHHGDFILTTATVMVGDFFVLPIVRGYN